MRIHVLLSVICFGGACLSASAQDASDPFPIRRILVPSKQVAAEVEKLNQGPTVAIRYQDLQRRLAALAQPAENESPHLIKAVYSAELSGRSLAGGRAEWTIRNPRDSAWMVLPRFALAISRPRIDGVDAVLGESFGQPGVWLDRPGASHLTFDWSLRGTPSPSGLAFDVALPSAPVSTLELRLPPELSPSSPQSNVLLSGPFESESPKFRLWRLQVTGKANFELLLRSASTTAGAGSMIADVESLHVHQPAIAQAEFDWHIDVLHHPIQELSFELDPRLQIDDVSLKGPELKEWQTREEKREKGPPIQLLVLRFRDPYVGAISNCKVKGWAPLVPGVIANPGMRLRHAVGRSEKLTLQFHSDLQLDSWDPGRFRLAASHAAADQSLVLTLHDSAPNGPTESRPRYEIRSQDAAFAVTESNAWKLGPSTQSLDLDLRIDVSRGKLFQLGLKLPLGKWKVASIRSEPVGLLRGWTASGSVVVVDFKKGIDPKTDAKVVASLVADIPLQSAGTELDFPDPEPLRASVRIGSLACAIDPSWNATVVRSSMPLAASGGSDAFRFEYRQEKLEGRLKLQPRRVRPVIRLEQETTIAGAHQTHVLRLDVDPARGAVRTVDLSVSPPFPADSVWRGSDVASVERLQRDELARVTAFVGAQTAWTALTTAASAPPTQVWRVHLREPLIQRAALEWNVKSPLQFEKRGERVDWPVPIALPVHADRGDVKVSVRAPEETILQSAQWGLEPVAASEAERSLLSWRVTGRTAFGPRLLLTRTPSAAAPEHVAVIDDARLRVSCETDGSATHYLAFEVRGWKQSQFPLTLSRSDAEVVAIAIDGRWSPRPLLKEAGGKATVLISAPSGKSAWRCEIAYATKPNADTRTFVWRIDPVEPEFPIPSTGLRRSWRLPPDWIPAQQESFTSWSRHKPGLDTLRRWWTWGSHRIFSQKGEFHPTMRSLVAAESTLRKLSSEARTLGDVLERFGSTLSPGAIVIDVEAMLALGLSPRTPVPANAWNDSQPLWTSFGLTARSIGDAVVFTTEAREPLWRTRDNDNWGEAILGAVAEAADRGQDGSGELQAVDFWMLHAAPSTPPRTLAFLGGDLPAGWTEWTPLRGVNPASWTALSVSRLRWSSWTIAAALALTVWSLRRRFSSTDQFRMLWLLLIGLVFGSFWIPLSLRDMAFAPMVVVFVGLTAWHVSMLVRKVRRSTPSTVHRHLSVKGASSFAIGIFAATASMGQGPTPFAVLIPTSEPNTAYVPTELLRRLQELENARKAVSVPAIVQKANYEGRHVDGRFEMEATFEVHAFEEKANWLLPLTGVDLKPGIFLDGAPVFPTPAAKGYVLTLPRKGTQRLTLSFVAKPVATDNRHDLRFGIPAAWSAQVQIQGSDLGRDVAFVRCIGEDAATADGKGIVARLKGELGPENVVHVRWQSASVAPLAKTTIRERYLWDLRAGHQGLTGILQVEPGRPGMAKLEIQLPPGLETRSLEAQTIGKSPLPLLKSWRISDRGGSKWIEAELNQTVSTPFRLIATWTPMFPIGPGRLDLRVPYPANAAFAESLLALAVENFEATDRPRNLGVTPLAAETFGKLWQEAGGKEAALISRAYSFGREAGQATQGAIEVTLSPMPTTVQADIAWEVHPSFADMVATAVWNANDDLAMLEATVPSDVVMMDVQGAHVHRWSRKGERIQIWLAQPRRQATIRLVGWRKHGGGGAETNAMLPAIRFMAKQVHTQVKVASSAGLSIQLDRSAGIKMQSDPALPNVLAGATDAANYELVVRARRESSRLDWRILTSADVQDQRGYLIQYVTGRLSHGEMPGFEIAVAGEHPMRLELAGSGVATPLRAPEGEQRWQVKYPPGAGSFIAFTLRGDFSAPTGSLVRMPEIRFTTGVVQSQIAASNGLAAAPGGRTSWVEAKSDDAELLPWRTTIPIVASKGTLLWKRNGTEALVLQVASTPTAKAPSVIGGWRHRFMTEQGEWLCDESFLVSTQTSQSIDVVHLNAKEWIEARLDDKSIVPIQQGANRFRIDADARGIHRLRILRRSENADDAGVLLVSRGRYPIEERIDLPSRWRNDEMHAPLAAAWLSESRTLFEASRLLLDTPSDPLMERAQLLEAQGRLRSLLVWSKARLSHTSDANLLEEWKHISEQNADLLKKHAVQVDVADSSQGGAGFSYAAAGVPFGRATMSDVPLAPIAMVLEANEARPPLWLIQIAAFVFCVIGLLSFLPRGLNVWTSLWPEQAMLLLAIGFWLWGFSFVGTTLLALAVTLRIAILVRLARLVLTRWRA